MLATFALGVGVRLWVLDRWYADVPLVEPDTINDNLYYHLSANLLADGHGFANPFEYFVNGTIVPTAAHPPGFTVYLSIWSWFGADTVTWHRFASGVLAASVVIPVALLVRRAIGPRAAVFSMIAVALYPPLWMNDALILSESMYIPLAAWALYFAHRAYEEPSIRRILELTVVLALGSLTRSEPFLMFFLLLTPLVMFHPRLEWRDRFRRTAMAAGVAMLILAPWVGRNVTIFDEPTYLAVGPGYVLELGNCDDTYSGEFLGYWSARCDDGTTWPVGADESGIGAAKYAKASDYIGDHITEVPKVVAARVGRLLGVYRPLQGIDFDVFFERRVRSHVTVGLWAHYAVMLLAIPGALIWRRRTTLLPVAAVAGVSIFTAAITFGISRYRIGADLVFVILAAVAAAHVLDRYGPARLRTTAAPKEVVDV
jgi:4-amino-4-deoxy-L-arabinose transferase-like glycosyltransferase